MKYGWSNYKFVHLSFFIALLIIFPVGSWGVTIKTGLSGGFRSDDLDWNIAGTTAGTNPNILSELKWKDVRSYYLDADVLLSGEKSLFKNTYPFLKIFGGYGWIFDGENTDSDFQGDDRTLEFLKSEAEVNDNDVWDIGAATGLSFRGGQKNNLFSISPYVGYTYRVQNFRMTDGVMVRNTITGDLGSFSGLDSTYKTKWYGPMIGGRLEYRNKKDDQDRFILWGEAEYSWFDYEADADWNLRTDLAHPKSFEHTASGDGYKLKGGGDYFINSKISIGFKGEWTDWRADDDGISKTNFSDGASAKTKLNEVNWESWLISLTVSCYF